MLVNDKEKFQAECPQIVKVYRSLTIFYLNFIFRFTWDIKRFQPDFSIWPIEGYITPGMDVTFDVEFHPKNINGDVRYDVRKIQAK